MDGSDLAVPGAIPRWSVAKSGGARRSHVGSRTDVPVAVAEDEEDRAVLTLVLDEAAMHPWSLGELERELGNGIAASDAVRRLRGAGLLHELQDDYVFPSRAAVRAYELLAG